MASQDQLPLSNVPCLTVGVLGSFDASRRNSAPSHDTFTFNNNEKQINFAILQQVSISGAVRLCCFVDACVIVKNNQLSLEMFRNLLMIIENLMGIKKVLVLVDLEVDNYENEFRKIIRRNLDYRIVSFSNYHEFYELSWKLTKMEVANETNVLFEWLRELAPNTNYDKLKDCSPTCSIINAFFTFAGVQLLVKVESGYIRHGLNIEFISESPTSVELYKAMLDFEGEKAYAGQFVKISLQEATQSFTYGEVRLLRGALLGNYFENYSKGSPVIVDRFWVELKIISPNFKFFNFKYFKLYCGQRELYCQLVSNRATPLLHCQDSFLVEFQPIRDLLLSKLSLSNLDEFRQPSIVTTFEKCQNRGICLIKQRIHKKKPIEIIAMGKIRKVVYLSEKSLWIDNEIQFFFNYSYEKLIGFSDISLIIIGH